MTITNKSINYCKMQIVNHTKKDTIAEEKKGKSNDVFVCI